MTLLPGSPSPTPDNQSQRLWLFLVIVGVVLAAVGWYRFFR